MEHAQRLAAHVVQSVCADGRSLTTALAAGSVARSPQRALVHELAYGTLRFLGQLRTIVRTLADRPTTHDSIEALLCVALYQLLHTTAPTHAVVDGAVRATAGLKRSWARGFTNAILRKFLRGRDTVLATIAHDPVARFSYPRWWIDRVKVDYAQRYETILDAGNARPPLTLRVNRRAMAQDRYLEVLTAHGIDARAIGDAGVIVSPARPVAELPGYAEGAFSVQDAGAQYAAPLLRVEDGMRVLDACAAPGGKTTHLAELASIDLVAIDIDSSRLERVHQNLSRLGLAARLVAADVADTSAWWDGQQFDRILIDAPCTASGVVRRHPDAKWLRRENDVIAFTEQQRKLLDALWPCLARGGRMLYATCSIFRAENGNNVDAFCERFSDAQRESITLSSEVDAEDGQLLPAGPGAEHNHDGFFYALLHKR
ncbi:MAG TPA: 16S rRNA (cytosine(967)-C(5))-methyltransferase RsmB [Casimicrobiaceae bacterium]|nr:16S rRNA (cytosine(967)-C(5))-methyltransferase RsmB [Casimicrobiaceae bacterium]